MKGVLTFIMAGGKGERLLPLTKDRAKPAVPFGGIYRTIDFPLSNCINSGLRRIHVLIQYKSISLERHLRMGWNIFNSELGEYIDIIPAQQRVGSDWYRGTADSIYQNIYSIELESPDYCLILAGDHIYKMDYSKLIAFHIERKADLTIGAFKMPKEKASQLGVLQADAAGEVVGFQEKPEKDVQTVTGEPDKILASMGIYVFKRHILEEELKAEAQDRSSGHDFSMDVIPKMIGRRKVFAYELRDSFGGQSPYWRDIGTLDDYYQANMDLVQVTPLFNLYDKEWPIRTYQQQFPPAKTVFAGTDEPSRMGLALDSLVSNGCIISGGRVQSSVLSPNVRVNSYSEVSHSILMEGVDVGRYAKIKRAIVDKDVEVPPEAEIGYNLERDRKNFHVTDSGVVVVAKKAEIEI